MAKIKGVISKKFPKGQWAEADHDTGAFTLTQSAKE